MSTTTQQAELSADLEAQLRRLSPAQKERGARCPRRGRRAVADEPLPPLSDEWKAEIGRRLEAIRRGEMEMLTVDEFFTRLDEKCRREGGRMTFEIAPVFDADVDAVIAVYNTRTRRDGNWLQRRS